MKALLGFEHTHNGTLMDLLLPATQPAKLCKLISNIFFKTTPDCLICHSNVLISMFTNKQT